MLQSDTVLQLLQTNFHFPTNRIVIGRMFSNCDNWSTLVLNSQQTYLRKAQLLGSHNDQAIRLVEKWKFG